MLLIGVHLLRKTNSPVTFSLSIVSTRKNVETKQKKNKKNFISVKWIPTQCN